MRRNFCNTEELGRQVLRSYAVKAAVLQRRQLELDVTGMLAIVALPQSSRVSMSDTTSVCSVVGGSDQQTLQI